MENKTQIMKYIRAEFHIGLKESLQIASNIQNIDEDGVLPDEVELVMTDYNIHYERKN